ncbi:Leukocidin S subunit [Staphylococcus aureus]|nr:Leukocidin S subunit [Staphylococcus aureus]
MHLHFRKNKDGQRLIVTYEVDWKNKTVKVVINILMTINLIKKDNIERADY